MSTQDPNEAIDIGEFQTSIRAAVYRTASGFHLSDDDISDIVQQVNEKLVRKLAMYNAGRAAVGTFIYTVARSTALDALRSRRRQPVQVELDEQAMNCDDALAVMMRQEQEQLVRSVVAELPAKERELAMHCMEDDFDLSAYAQSLGIARETLYVRKHRLMLKIGNALRNRLAA